MVHSHAWHVQTSPVQQLHPASHSHAASHAQADSATVLTAQVAVAAAFSLQPHFSHSQTSHEHVSPSQSGQAQLTHSHVLAMVLSTGAESADAQVIMPSENEKSAANTNKLFMEVSPIEIVKTEMKSKQYQQRSI
ncbi:hypothetical protein M4951_22450 [Blastopirellula sp. J2-11]|uniref:hypothetical protein n=1 Tax=Blastopirellula sp. J2-11 TaxID=2943192 RepID=UPI0021CA0A8C|nr:hypothetical protein [Blastopirellula sp. J2-11]UUO06108.1 hypothetical protein M4951_22450 [Blastopirellula sp. J2-11]